MRQNAWGFAAKFVAMLLTTAWSLMVTACMLAAPPAHAEKKYGPGVTDTEIKIGQTMPYSGPASGYATIGKAEAAYFEMINVNGGVNGRKIRLISQDDGFSPPKAVDDTRRMVEQDGVLLIFNSLGTPSNLAIRKYLNDRKVPHLFVAAASVRFGDPENFPWTMGYQATGSTEARIYAKYILQNYPKARIGVLYQNDDAGRDFLTALKGALGDKALKMIVAEESYEIGTPTVDSQIVALKGSGADIFVNISLPKAAAQAIRKAHDIGWKPLHFLNSISASVQTVLTPAGLEKSVGLITAIYLRDPSDPQWANDPGVKEYYAWMRKYYPGGDPDDGLNAYAYSVAQTLVRVLKDCGDDLTRENVMRQAASIKDLQLPMIYPGIKINTSPTDYFPIQQMQLQRFDGTHWVPFSEILGD